MTFRRLIQASLSVAVFASAGGCALGPNYRKPTVAAPESWKHGQPVSDGLWQDARPQDDAVRGAWWKVFQDPILDKIEAQVLEHNQTLEAALARLERARAVARLPAANLLPRLDMNADYLNFQRSLGGFGGSGSITDQEFTVPFDLSYEVDLWGRIRRSWEAARAEAQASQAAYETVLLSVTAEAARTYFLLRALDAELEALRRTVELRVEAQRVVKERVGVGLASELDLARVEAEVKTAEAESLSVQRQRDELEHALAVLCGQAAPVFTAISDPLDVSPPRIPSGIPSRALERRPDVAEAERLMAAANARIGVAKAASFPVVTLFGSYGWQGAKWDDLFHADSRVWSYGPSISVPMFAGGRNAANLRAARADHEEATANYRYAVLAAFREVEDALTAANLLAQQQQAQNGVVEASQRAAKLSIDRYTQGLVNFLDVVDAERARLAAERQAAQIRGQRMAAAILLIKALGGGWDAAN